MLFGLLLLISMLLPFIHLAFIFYSNSAQHTVQWTKNSVNCLLYLSRDILQHHQLSTEIMRHDINWDRCTSQRSTLSACYLSFMISSNLLFILACYLLNYLLSSWLINASAFKNFRGCFLDQNSEDVSFFSATRSIYLKIVTENVFMILSY